MIGQRRLAERLANAKVDQWDIPIMPKSWQYLDTGSYRHAFIGPDGRVYKRSTVPGEDGNILDWEFYLINNEYLSETVRLPKMYYFKDIDILVQEYIRNDDTDTEYKLWSAVEDVADHFQKYDWSIGDNVLISGGIAYVVDCGM